MRAVRPWNTGQTVFGNLCNDPLFDVLEEGTVDVLTTSNILHLSSQATAITMLMVYWTADKPDDSRFQG